MANNRFKKALEAFSNSDSQSVEDRFMNIAKEIILGGHFEVTYRDSEGDIHTKYVYVVDVEGYYFDEKNIYDETNDWIVYHRTHYSSSKEPQKPDYLPIGSLNLHDSGIDITFENKTKNYRASMLLRSFQVYDKIPTERCEKDVDERSTYMYDALFPFNKPIGCDDSYTWNYKIVWMQTDQPDEEVKNRIKTTVRKNVAKYQWVDGKKANKGETKFKEPQKVPFEEGKHELKTENGNYAQDEKKKWRFFDENFMSKLKAKDSK